MHAISSFGEDYKSKRENHQSKKKSKKHKHKHKSHHKHRSEEKEKGEKKHRKHSHKEKWQKSDKSDDELDVSPKRLKINVDEAVDEETVSHDRSNLHFLEKQKALLQAQLAGTGMGLIAQDYGSASDEEEGEVDHEITKTQQEIVKLQKLKEQKEWEKDIEVISDDNTEVLDYVDSLLEQHDHMLPRQQLDSPTGSSHGNSPNEKSLIKQNLGHYLVDVEGKKSTHSAYKRLTDEAKCSRPSSSSESHKGSRSPNNSNLQPEVIVIEDKESRSPTTKGESLKEKKISGSTKRRRSRSPRRKSRSPRRKSRSPRRDTSRPKRKSRSPKLEPAPKSKSISPKRKISRSPRKEIKSRTSPNKSPTQKSWSPRRRPSPIMRRSPLLTRRRFL